MAEKRHKGHKRRKAHKVPRTAWTVAIMAPATLLFGSLAGAALLSWAVWRIARAAAAHKGAGK